MKSVFGVAQNAFMNFFLVKFSTDWLTDQPTDHLIDRL